MMSLSLHQLSFYYFFSILFLLLFLFAESFLGIYIIGLFSLFFIVFSNKINFSNVSRHKGVFLLWILFLVGLIFSSFFTHGVTLTLDSIVYYLFSFQLFSFFTLVNPNFITKKPLFFCIISVVLTLGVMSFVFSLFPRLAESIPGMNLVYPTFGHNHFGALAILVLPIIWNYLIKRYKHKQNILLLFLAFSFILLNLLLSFGRIVILIGLFEIIVLGLLAKSMKIKIGKLTKTGFFSVLFIVIATIVVKNFFTVAYLFNSNITCPIPIYQSKICKNLKKDLRHIYWGTSSAASKDNPIFGYGPGTYSLINEKYKLRPDANTSYAHNAFFQMYAETGFIVGTIFLILMSSLLVLGIYRSNVSKQVKNKKYDLSFYTLLGLFAVYINILFDFDWSFLGTYCLSLIFIVSLISRSENTQLRLNIRDKVFKFLYYLIFVLLILLSSLSLIVEYHISRSDIKSAVSTFPYFQSHMKIFTTSPDLDESSKKKIDLIYQNFSYRDGIGVNLEFDDQMTLLSPWYYYSSTKMLNLYENNSQFAVKEVNNLAKMVKKAKDLGYEGQVVTDNTLADLSVKAGDDYLKNGEIFSAIEMYELAIFFHKWVFNDIFPGFLYLLTTDSQKYDYWSTPIKIDTQSYGRHSEAVGKEYQKVFREALKEKNANLTIFSFNQMMKLTPWLTDGMVEKELVLVQGLVDDLIDEGNHERAVDILEIMTDIGYMGNMQLGNYYLKVGNNDSARTAYKLCIERAQKESGVLHEDCSFALDSIGSGETGFYDKVRQSILGI